MISPAFWLVRGSELKITGSDDPSHTPLLQTIGNRLDGQTIRSKITSYGEVAKFGPVISVWEVVRFNMADSTSQQTGFNRLIAMETSKAPTRSASGVTGVLGMEQ